MSFDREALGAECVAMARAFAFMLGCYMIYQTIKPLWGQRPRRMIQLGVCRPKNRVAISVVFRIAALSPDGKPFWPQGSAANGPKEITQKPTI